jgi:hypothetical protein
MRRIYIKLGHATGGHIVIVIFNSTNMVVVGAFDVGVTLIFL